MPDPRLQAALILQEVLEQQVFTKDAKQRFPVDSEIDSAFVNMLLQTTLRHLVYAKKILKNFIKKKLPSSSKLGNYILYLGVTEILYMNTPDYAVINSYVNIAKKELDKYVAGFINAVLRKVCANKKNFTEEDTGEFFPQEFRCMLNKSYSKKTINAIEKASIKEPFLDISVKENFAIPQALTMPLGSLRLKNSGNVTKISGYSEGKWWVQDFSSALPVKLLGDINGLRVLDVCAAPGGKTAQLLAAGAKVTALDISNSRLETLKENLARLKLNTQEVICADALAWLQEYEGEPFDVILLDAPCSATGTLRRHPELVHIKNLNDVTKMAEIQKNILSLAASKLKKGGILAYCTCSLAKEEGEKQIASFLQQHSDYKTVRQDLPLQIAELTTPEGWVRVLPSHLSQFGGADGFFIALLTKEQSNVF